jgi:hydrogenase maturation factor
LPYAHGAHYYLTEHAIESFRTAALESVDQVQTSAAILTRHASALVDVDLAVGSGVAWLALAGVGVDPVIAGASILARTSDAFVDVDLTMITFKSWLTSANKRLEKAKVNIIIWTADLVWTDDEGD